MIEKDAKNWKYLTIEVPSTLSFSVDFNCSRTLTSVVSLKLTTPDAKMLQLVINVKGNHP